MSVIRTLANILAGLVLGVALALLIATQVFGYRLAAVATDSMRPALTPGDLIVTQPAPITEITHDDIVLFETGVNTRILVAHRVVNLIQVNLNITDSQTGETRTERSQMLRTKGDANADIDPEPVDASNYRGRLWLTFAGAGSLLATPTPFILIAVVLGAAWLATELLRARRPRSAGVQG